MNAVTKYRCGNCGTIHTTYSDAMRCCPPDVDEVLVCGVCGKRFSVHFEVGEAEACCKAKAVETVEATATNCWFCNGKVGAEDKRDSKILGSQLRCRSCIIAVAPEFAAA